MPQQQQSNTPFAKSIAKVVGKTYPSKIVEKSPKSKFVKGASDAPKKVTKPVKDKVTNKLKSEKMGGMDD